MPASNNSSLTSLTPPSEIPDETILVVFSVLLAFLSLVSIIVNFVSIALFMKNKELLANPANKLVFNFTVSSFAVSIFTMPTSFISFAMKEWPFKEFICHVSGILSICLPIVELLTLGAMAYDRHHFIVNPLTYPINMTSFKVNVIIFFIWFVSIVAGLMPVFGWGSYGYNRSVMTCTVLWPQSSSFGIYFFVVGFVMPLVIQVYCYAGIARAAKKQAKFGRRMSRVAIVPLQVAKIIRETSAAKTIRKICIVMGIFFLTWLPIMIIIMVSGYKKGERLVTQFFIANNLAYCSTFAYPLLFVFRARNLKKELRTLLSSSRLFNCINTVTPEDDVESSERKERRRSSLSTDGYDLGSRRRSSRISRVSWAMPVVIEDGVEPSKEPRPSVTASTITTDISSNQVGCLLPGEMDYSGKQTEICHKKTNRIV